MKKWVVGEEANAINPTLHSVAQLESGRIITSCENGAQFFSTITKTAVRALKDGNVRPSSVGCVRACLHPFITCSISLTLGFTWLVTQQTQVKVVQRTFGNGGGSSN